MEWRKELWIMVKENVWSLKGIDQPKSNITVIINSPFTKPV